VYRLACLPVAFFLLSLAAAAAGQDKPAAKAPDGIYAVLRDGEKEKDLLPLKDGERVVVNRGLHLKPKDRGTPRYLVVRVRPDVMLHVEGEPKAVKEGGEVTRVLLTLQPRAAKALERLTTDRVGKQVAIVLDGEVVSAHKVREAIKGGQVQITSCDPGGAKHVLDKLQARGKGK
jgi:preprotein translocase subunit SecD